MSFVEIDSTKLVLQNCWEPWSNGVIKVLVFFFVRQIRWIFDILECAAKFWVCDRNQISLSELSHLSIKTSLGIEGMDLTKTHGIV